MKKSELEECDRVVFTLIDSDGYPYSCPVKDFEIREESVTIKDFPKSRIRERKRACLLFHSHTQTLERLKQYLLKGSCRRQDKHIIFDKSSVFSFKNENFLDFIDFVTEGKKKTNEYFDTNDFLFDVSPLRS